MKVFWVMVCVRECYHSWLLFYAFFEMLTASKMRLESLQARLCWVYPIPRSQARVYPCVFDFQVLRYNKA